MQGADRVPEGHSGPRIVPVRYGADKARRRYGLVIVNEGATAYNVCIPNYGIRIGSELLVFGRGLAWLSPKTGEAIIDSWTEEQLENAIFRIRVGELFELMAKNNVDVISIEIAYKDEENHWYESACELVRDVNVQGGITTRFVNQRPIGRPHIHKRKSSAWIDDF